MAALRDVLRSRVFSDVACTAGVSRESLHRTLSNGRDARMSTLTRVLRAIGCRLAVVPEKTEPKKRRRAKVAISKE